MTAQAVAEIHRFKAIRPSVERLACRKNDRFFHWETHLLSRRDHTVKTVWLGIWVLGDDPKLPVGVAAHQGHGVFTVDENDIAWFGVF